MKPALYIGSINHQRSIPKKHRFSYPFFMWFFNLDEISTIQEQGFWFSSKRFALSRFHRPDYFGNPEEPLHTSIKNRMKEITGQKVKGQVYGLMNLRTLGLYFSPVNFYFGFDQNQNFSHFLAEVSNIPWNQRHQYAYHIDAKEKIPDQKKQFHVSPFNHLDQSYRWHIEPPGEKIRVGLGVDDARGHIFSARLELERHAFDRKTIKKQLLKRPVMTASIITAIHWQALKLYLKGVPYVPYKKEAT